jgi:hypothetical protein
VPGKLGAILFKLSHDGLMPKAASIDPETSCFRGYCAEARRCRRRSILEPRLANQEYTEGKTSNVSSVEVIKPPMTTVASGRCISAPALVDIAIGTKPRLAMRAVIMTGPNRIMAASTTACRGSIPVSCNCAM